MFGRQSLTGVLAGVCVASACSSGSSLPHGAAGQSTVPASPPSPTASSTSLDSADPGLVQDLQGQHPTLGAATDDNPARPVVTGTLLVTADGAYAFASDVDRDAVFQVSLSERTVRRVDVPAGEQPGQLVEVPTPGGGTRVLTVLRAGGAVLAIDPGASETARFDVCSAPRGLTYEPRTQRVYVACESGELVTLDPTSGAAERVVNVAPDLRDVQVVSGALLVSRYRSAEVLALDDDGTIRAVNSPASMPGCAEPAVLHRLLVRDGTAYMAHQMDTMGMLPTDVGGYEDAEGCAAAPIEPELVVTATEHLLPAGAVHLGVFAGVHHLPLGEVPTNEQIVGQQDGHIAIGLARRAGPIDLAVGGSGRVAMTFTGDSLWPGVNALVTFTPDENHDGQPAWRYEEYPTSGTLTAVAFDASNRWVAQSREPAQLLFEDGSTVSLDPTSAANTGLDLFYVNTGGGLSCAGCHPEGDEDGRTWAFPQGLRRTQPLGGGVMSREPFHWDGEMPTMDHLVNEVMLQRMSFHTPLQPQQIELLGRWLDGIPAPSSVFRGLHVGTPRSNADAVERGRTLFFDETVACGTCHSGPAYTDNKAYDVGTGGTFFTPTLLGIGLRHQIMHDGCAKTLHQRFGVCGGTAHGTVSHLEPEQIDDLVAFMQTL